MIAANADRATGAIGLVKPDVKAVPALIRARDIPDAPFRHVKHVNRGNRYIADTPRTPVAAYLSAHNRDTSGSLSGGSAAFKARASFACFRLGILTIADLPSSLAGAGVTGFALPAAVTIAGASMAAAFGRFLGGRLYR